MHMLQNHLKSDRQNWRHVLVQVSLKVLKLKIKRVAILEAVSQPVTRYQSIACADCGHFLIAPFRLTHAP